MDIRNEQSQASVTSTVPTEEELYNVSLYTPVEVVSTSILKMPSARFLPCREFLQRMAPDIRKKVDAARALRLAMEAEMKQQVAVQAPPTTLVDPDTIKPIWADTNSKK
ncbi:hypothetical protein C8J55DRAFT_560505 [Lentinula edodes]|uniref:Uncharacterized protein n=1 Tax=Lentinula lateritia TaxID=40482 RepID=A0A9W9ADZ1_9AGAR|nr:hypothetical protein C8J55DRAFT_560505 [Lentinula edodes]